MSQFHGGTSNGSKRKRSECNDYFDEKKRILYTEDGIPATTLFLPSLNNEVGYHHIFHHFSTFGTVDSVRIQGNPRNWFASVTFTQFESAARAMDMQFHIIVGHHTLVEIAKREHQMAIELTNGTGTTLLDLNDDCLNEIFSSKTIRVTDLCSVARTSVRLNGMANQIFKRNHKKCRFRLLVSTPIEARRLITTFSSLIEDVRFGASQFVAKEWTNLLDLIARCSTDSLKYLTLIKVSISENTMSNLQTQLKDLKKLEVRARESALFSEELNAIIGTSYPKLEEFKFDCDNSHAFEMFLSRHQNLKSLCRSWCRSPVLPIIVENCKILQILKLFFYYPQIDFEEALKRLLVLDHLKVLHIRCATPLSVTNFVRELNTMKSLTVLRLQNVHANSEFLPAISQLKRIRVLSLINCRNLLSNFDLLGEMKQLNDLCIQSSENFEINGLFLIERLINLEIIDLLVQTFKVDKRMYLRIVDVVKGRPERSKQTLEINCLANGVDDFDVGIHQTVKLNRIANMIDYGLSDY